MAQKKNCLPLAGGIVIRESEREFQKLPISWKMHTKDFLIPFMPVSGRTWLCIAGLGQALSSKCCAFAGIWIWIPLPTNYLN